MVVIRSVDEAVDVDAHFGGLGLFRAGDYELLDGGVSEELVEPVAGEFPRLELALQEEFVVGLLVLDLLCIFLQFGADVGLQLLAFVAVVVADADGLPVYAHHQVALHAELAQFAALLLQNLVEVEHVFSVVES
jgi:hypothetical protein